MTVVPKPMTGPTTPALRRVHAADAERLGLATIRQLTDHYGSSVASVRLYLRRPGAPRPVGETERPNATRREKLFVLAHFEDFVSSQGDTLGSRRRSRPPRRIGTATPSAGRVYRWRDPVRGR